MVSCDNDKEVYVFGVDDTGEIEYIRYLPEFLEQAKKVLRESFFVNEAACIATEIPQSNQAAADLELLCEHVASGGVSLLARTVATKEVVGISFNLLQSPSGSGNEKEPTYFENFRDTVCQTDYSRGLMQFMIDVDGKFDIFADYGIDCTLEIMFLAVLPEYGQRSIGTKLCEYSIQLASAIKKGELLDYLPEDMKMRRPKAVTAIFTSLLSQKIGVKLGFRNVFEVPYSAMYFQGKSYAERLNQTIPSTILVAKELL